MKTEPKDLFMRTLVVYVTMGISTALAAPPTAPSFSINISTAQSMVKVGAAITIDATLTNISDHDIFYAVGTPGQVIDLIVCDSSGKSVPETPYGRKVHDTELNRRPFVGSVFRASIKPDHTFQQKSDLSKEYDLSKPDKYSIQAQRRDARTREMVKSNTITITVTH
jgi:hypothetical protein